MTAILFDSTRTRKTTRRTFGLGLVKPADNRPRRSGRSEADRAWATYHLNADCQDYFLAGDPDAELDRRAAQAEADAMIESGFFQF
jgi:hypothetical protein